MSKHENHVIDTLYAIRWSEKLNERPAKVADVASFLGVSKPTALKLIRKALTSRWVRNLGGTTKGPGNGYELVVAA